LEEILVNNKTLTFTLSVKENTNGVCFKNFFILKTDWLKTDEELSAAREITSKDIHQQQESFIMLG